MARARKRICDAAVEVLRETNNPAVMWGDVHLLHMIADRADAKCKGKMTKTERGILAALTRQPGILVPRHTYCHGKRVRIFRLPECL